MDPRLAELRKQNRALCESAATDAKLPVSETLAVLVSAGAAVIAEAVKAGKRADGLFRAKVGHADKVNENDRVYPRAEWQRQIDAVNTSLGEKGGMLGAVDHQGCSEGGNLKTSPIIWRSLDMTEAGDVFGNFEIVEGHSSGRDLKAIVDAGAQVGFSTFGYANAHRPSKDEAEKYALPYDETVEDDEYDGPIVIDNWDLIKIDSVDNPAVRDARITRDNTKKAGGTRTENVAAKSAENDETTMDIKTLDDLQKQLPDVFALHTAELAKLQGQVDALKLTDQKYGQILKRLSDSLTCLAKEHNAPVPLKDGAEVNAELEKQVADLTRAVADAKALADAKDAEKSDLQSKLDKIEAEKTDLQRRADVKAKADELLKDNKFAAVIRKAIESKIADASFDVAALEKLVADKTAEGEEFAKVLNAKPADPVGDAAKEPKPIVVDGLPKTGVDGVTFTAADDDLDDGDGVTGAFKPLPMFAEAAK